MAKEINIYELKKEIERLEAFPHKTLQIKQDLERKIAQLEILANKMTGAKKKLTQKEINLSDYDKDVRDLIFINTFILKEGKPMPLSYALDDKNINQSSYSEVLNFFGSVLQKIKKNDPRSFEAIKNLKKEKEGFKIYLFMDSWPGPPDSTGCYYHAENIMLLKCYDSSHGSALVYHELMHTADDGKEIRDIGDIGVEKDYISSSSEDLAGKIKKYCDDLKKEWIVDYPRFKKLMEGREKVAVVGNKIIQGKADYEEKKLHAELIGQYKQECGYFSNKYWFLDFKLSLYFYDFDFAPGIEEVDIPGEGLIGVPYLLNGNTELIAWALDRLENGTPHQQMKIKGDKTLIEIIELWRNY